MNAEAGGFPFLPPSFSFPFPLPLLCPRNLWQIHYGWLGQGLTFIFFSHWVTYVFMKPSWDIAYVAIEERGSISGRLKGKSTT